MNLSKRTDDVLLSLPLKKKKEKRKKRKRKKNPLSLVVQDVGLGQQILKTYRLRRRRQRRQTITDKSGIYCLVT